jgi:hypothetical protein
MNEQEDHCGQAQLFKELAWQTKVDKIQRQHSKNMKRTRHGLQRRAFSLLMSCVGKTMRFHRDMS